MYRIDRHDAMSDVPVNAPVEEQLAWCGTNLIRVNRREGSLRVKPDGRPALEARDAAAPDSGIVFGRGWYAVESHIPPEVFRWAGESAELLLEDPPEPGCELALDVEPGPSIGGRPLQLEVEVAGEAPVCLTFDGRRRVRLRFASPYPKRLQFRTKDAGVRVCGDPRPLNFRMFRVEWERERAAGGEGARSLQATLQPVSWMTRAAQMRNAFLHLMRKLAGGWSAMPLTVPVSPGLRRVLTFFVGGDGQGAASDPGGGSTCGRARFSAYERVRRFHLARSGTLVRPAGIPGNGSVLDESGFALLLRRTVRRCVRGGACGADADLPHRTRERVGMDARGPE